MDLRVPVCISLINIPFGNRRRGRGTRHLIRIPSPGQGVCVCVCACVCVCLWVVDMSSAAIRVKIDEFVRNLVCCHDRRCRIERTHTKAYTHTHTHTHRKHKQMCTRLAVGTLHWLLYLMGWNCYQGVDESLGQGRRRETPLKRDHLK